MRLKRLTCSNCKLQLGGYNKKTGTLVLDVKTHPTIAFFVDATEPSADDTPAAEVPSSSTASGTSHYSVNIACPSCGYQTPFEAVSIRFGTMVKKSRNAPMTRPPR